MKLMIIVIETTLIHHQGISLTNKIIQINNKLLLKIFDFINL